MNNSDDFSHFASSMVLKPKEALKSPGGLLKSQIDTALKILIK